MGSRNQPGEVEERDLILEKSVLRQVSEYAESAKGAETGRFTETLLSRHQYRSTAGESCPTF